MKRAWICVCVRMVTDLDNVTARIARDADLVFHSVGLHWTMINQRSIPRHCSNTAAASLANDERSAQPSAADDSAQPSAADDERSTNGLNASTSPLTPALFRTQVRAALAWAWRVGARSVHMRTTWPGHYDCDERRRLGPANYSIPHGTQDFYQHANVPRPPLCFDRHRINWLCVPWLFSQHRSVSAQPFPAAARDGSWVGMMFRR